MSRLILSACVLLTASCSEFGSFAGLPWMDESAEAPLVCNSASPCPANYRCSFGTCTDVMQEFREVAIAVRLGDQVQHLRNVDLSNSTQFDTALNHERIVIGSFATSEDKGIQAAIVARLEEAVEGHPVLRQTTTDEEGNFRLSLTQGAVWSIDIMPSGDEIPAPPRQNLRQITGDLVESTRLEIRVPPAPDYPVYTGRLTDGEDQAVQSFGTVPSPNGNEPSRLQFKVIDARGRHIGNHLVIDGDGHFSFRAHPDITEAMLLVRGTQTRHPAALSEMLELSPEQTELGEVSIPLESGSSLLSITTANPMELNSMPVVGEIRIRPLAAQGRVVHRIALSGATSTQLDLPLGHYSIDVLPEPSTGFAPIMDLETEVRQGSTNALVVPLAPLIDLTGRVVTPDGSPAINVRIVCNQSEMVSETLTDETGAFSLKVQKGATFISAIPAPPSPRVLVDMNLIGTQSLNLVIDDGIMLTGSLMRPEARETQGNAVISVLAPWKTFDGAAVVLGETVVNSDGMFTVSLPPF